MTPTPRRRAESAAAQLRRLLQLIPELADGDAHAIAEVARRADVSPATLISDLNALVERYDVPAGWVDAVSILIDDERVSVQTDHFRRPMRLTMSELCALELGLMVVARERPAEEQPVIASALKRLREAITALPADDPAMQLRVAEIPDAADGTLATIRAALRAGRKVRIRYRSGASEEVTERVVCPYTTVFASGAWYVVALCERADSLRFFRLDRVESAEGLDATFERPASYSPDQVLPHGRAFSAPVDGAGTMRVRYSARIARWIAEREARALDADGSLTMEHPLADEEWGIRHVLQYGPDAEVLAPVALRETLRKRLQAMVNG